MSVAAPAPPFDLEAAAQAPRIGLERVRLALLWLTGVAGAFVFIEPSPYEVVSLLTIFVFAMAGLTLRASLMPLMLLLILDNIGFSIAVVPVLDQPKTLTWVLISWYMAATAIFFAAMLAHNTQPRLSMLLRGYSVAAAIAALAGIAGYFNLISSEQLLLYGRARGTFNDPNVLGAFLVLPMLLALQRILSGRLGEIMRGGTLFVVLAAGLLLSFSRGAWAQFAVSAVALMVMTFIVSRSSAERLRLVVLAVLGFLALTAFVAALLSIDRVAELFQERATLDQSYDVGTLGRFGRHILGALLAIDQPFGIGPLQFAHYFPEDAHNTYLNAFVSGGWLSGFTYFTLVSLTLVAGLRFAFVATPWQRTYLVVYAAFLGTAAESAIIDSDHWRHYWLLIGVLWGLIAASRPYRRPRTRSPGGALAPSLQRV
jgi:hypothetical protein